MTHYREYPYVVFYGEGLCFYTGFHVLPEAEVFAEEHPEASLHTYCAECGGTTSYGYGYRCECA